MAELVASKLAQAVVSQAVRTISDLLIREATSLSSVKDDVESLRTELRRMQCFLKDAESKQQQDERVRNWVAEVKDVACEIEDAIEKYIFKVNSSYLKAFHHLRKLRSRINSIKNKLQSIGESRQRYQIEFSSEEGIDTSALKNLRRSYLDDDDDDDDDHSDDVITLKDTTAALKAQLMKEEDRCCVVSIVGMGGLGKTTLAKKAYNDIDVKKHFDCRAWVFVSQQFVPKDILSEMLVQVGFQPKGSCKREILQERKNKRDALRGFEDHELIDLMKDELKEKRYLIILDDIWNIEAWYSIQGAFLKGKRGSKVVFTTRIKEVALSAGPNNSSPIHPPLLTPSESWELLKRKAFPRETFGKHACPPQFEVIGKEMIRNCGGLPLAIVVLGGLLRNKNSLGAWEKVQKDAKSHINKLKSEQQYRVDDILDLSFQDLPYYLKPCFLYLGSFPEDSEIPKSMLIRLWMAEGFISTMEREDIGGELIENVAEQYLGELVDRCMVQVDKRDHTGKGVKTCRLHDLMREFCISKAKTENFLDIMQKHHMNMMTAGSSSVQFHPATRFRRIAIHVNDHDLHHRTPNWMEQVGPNIRSLLCFGIDTLPIVSVTKNCILLRVLKLDFNWTKFPSNKSLRGIGNLIHLRYLRLSGASDESKLPRSIGNLQNLHTLDLRGNENGTMFLPRTLSRLVRLKILLLPWRYSCTSLVTNNPFGYDSLTNIETLKGIYAKDLVSYGAVRKLTNIRNLEVSSFRSDKEVSLVLQSLGFQLGHLQSLRMHMSKGEFPNLELLSQCHVLSKLSLEGELSREALSVLPKSLTKINLRFFRDLNQELAVLEKLPNLRILRLDNDLVDETSRNSVYKLVCSANGFPKLEVLTLRSLYRLEKWEVEEGAMPNLKRLNMIGLQTLKAIPEGLKYVPTLRELHMVAMWRDFEDNVRVNEEGVEGKDFYKVRHIPFISYSR